MSAFIFVVDDNPVNLKLVCDVLEFEGYTIGRAADAEEAQEILREATPDLILMDVALPGMDGLTLTRKLKSEARWRHVPIVALTAFAMKGDDEKARAAGCDAYITKPINTRKLPEQIAEILRNAAEGKRSSH
jgi:CheY-like chemotaxis protein